MSWYDKEAYDKDTPTQRMSVQKVIVQGSRYPAEHISVLVLTIDCRCFVGSKNRTELKNAFLREKYFLRFSTMCVFVCEVRCVVQNSVILTITKRERNVSVISLLFGDGCCFGSIFLARERLSHKS